jgi:F0F1-type ATP synthase membrane subunit c/vacuolar-type H+-ATPase subunit K
LLAFGTDLINGAALWKIILASLVGGAGVAIVFGVLLLGLSRARSPQAGGRTLGYAVAGLSAAFCIAAVVFGLIATIDKPASKPSPPSKSAALAPYGQAD